jgi:uncharacterized protein YbjT (DUF2867 family)
MNGNGFVLVTGATGNIGVSLVRTLSDYGAQVRGGIHSKEKAELVELPGVDTVVIDFMKPQTIKQALRGVDRVFLLTPYVPDMVEMVNNVVEQCKIANVRHIVRSSVMRAEFEEIKLTQLHRQAERIVEESKIPFTHIRPNSFMENFKAHARTIKRQGEFYSAAGGGNVSMVDVRDIASVAARVLMEGGFENNAYTVTGPDSLSYYQAADIFSKVLGRTITYKEISQDQAREKMREQRMSEWHIESMLEWYQLQMEDKLSEVTPAIRQIAKKEPITFNQFVTEYGQIFQKELVEVLR